ncbi:hypothetical protein [Nostoc sp. GT001]|uniref:hypothetical protein n=1 Tax=Nostoc sp. GT001 TaxID=3056647 RepID=UPI000E0027AA|nr:hypothetical protein [Nostoc sp. GT001]MDM9580459.1 hypothetical protein [Nostoc sp. GT001]RCJ21277.1 hypothetical protein A6S26_24625 [Nostoc sp. ATCC 43529]
MKLANPLNFANLVGSILLPRIANNQTATYNKSETSITLPSNPININSLQPFGTAIIAYYMMGIGNFE